MAGREGIWDGPMAGAVASRAADLEEGRFYDTFRLDVDLGITGPIADEDMMLPTLPEVCRFHEIKVSPPDSRLGPTVVTWKRRKGDGTPEVIVESFDSSIK